MIVWSDEELLVLRLRLGSGERPYSSQEAAALLGVPVSTVEEIDRTALRKLRLSALSVERNG